MKCPMRCKCTCDRSKYGDCRARLRRRPSDEVLDEQLMREVAITGYKQPVKGPGQLQSADAKATLDSIYGSMDDTSNKYASIKVITSALCTVETYL